MDRRKVISDWIIATQETVYILQMWLGLLEGWRERGQAEPDDFMEAYHQLKEAELGQWASQAGGHGIIALAESVSRQTGSRGSLHRDPRPSGSTPGWADGDAKGL